MTHMLTEYLFTTIHCCLWFSTDQELSQVSLSLFCMDITIGCWGVSKLLLRCLIDWRHLRVQATSQQRSLVNTRWRICEFSCRTGGSVHVKFQQSSNIMSV
ncbi:hypothetical protein SRHO_G00185770 [Serrasalmus rhombeus]